MTTNSSLILSSLDFDTLKDNFKVYLSSQSIFKDYNFDGSNINVLLDVMAYNSHLNSFYLNMVASEMFLDSAQKYDSVVSHAKELNYIPVSAKSSSSEISFQIETVGINNQLTVPKGTRFSGTNSNGSFTFTTDEVNVYVSGNSTFSVANLTIYEGTYFTDTYVVNYNIENQQFLLTNEGVDTTTLTVTVVENNGATITTFIKADNLFGLNSESNVFFLQGAQNGKYEIVFGDGLFGRRPINASIIQINYRVCSGKFADGVSSFILADDLGSVNNGEVSAATINVNFPSNSGSDQESLESIRFAAPRFFATQQRAVSSDDYASLILSNFSGLVSDVVVYGGETVEPKQYGRVIISIKPLSGTIAPDFLKNSISNYLLDYIALPNRVVISDPDYLYCYVNAKVNYDKNSTVKTSSEIRSIVLNSILGYGSNNLEKFGNDLRYSRLTTTIDNSDSSITSNETELRAVKRISPKINFATSYDFNFNNPIYYDSFSFNTIEQHSLLHESNFDVIVNHASLLSSRFTYVATDGISYPLAFLEDDASTIDDNGVAVIKVYIENQGNITPIATVGQINYVKGVVQLTDLKVSSYDNYISLFVRLRDKDIIANQNKIILIDANDVNITISETVR
jgi:hypothetical protein